MRPMVENDNVPLRNCFLLDNEARQRNCNFEKKKKKKKLPFAKLAAKQNFN